MAETDYTGEWFLPGSENKYPGRLIINKKKKLVRLELFSPKSIDGEVVTKGLDSHPAHFHEYILGTGHFFEKTTLYNCYLRKVSHIGKDFAQINYEAEFMFTGVHISILTELMIESGTFIFPYLSSWYDGWKSLDKLDGGKSGIYFSDDEKMERTLNSPEEAKPEHLPVNDSLTIVFFEKLEKRLKTIGVHYEVRFQKYISFTYKRAVSFKQLLSDASIFGKLLSFSISEPLYYDLLSIKMSEVFMSKQKSLMHQFQYLEVFVSGFALSRGKVVNQHGLHQNSQIISHWTFSKEELNNIIVTWFSNSHFFHVYDYYNDSNNWFQGSEEILSNVMFNNRFLNIIQGLEHYYRKTTELEKPDILSFNERKEKVLSFVSDFELRSWLSNELRPPKHLGLEGKLSSLIVRFHAIINMLYSNKEIIKLFPRQATIRRHQMSHGNTKTSQGFELELYFYFGRTLLAICILESLKVDDIAKRIEKCYRMNDKIRMLNSIKIVRQEKLKS